MYVFKDPLGSTDVKIGITGNPKVRLGTYQCAYSAKSHKACFDYVWVGPPKHIDLLERALKEKYKWDIASDRLGESEWISDLSIQDLIKVVDQEIQGWRFHIKVLDADFPVRTDDISWGRKN